jgi:hypothetical protein
MTSLTDEQGQALYGPNPGLHLGPFLIGLFLDSILLGTVLTSFWTWWSHCEAKEKIWIKVLVVSTYPIYSSSMTDVPTPVLLDDT